MKRAAIAVVAAVGGFAGVLGFNLGGSRAPLLQGATGSNTGSNTGTNPGSSTGSNPPATSSSSSSSSSSSGSPSSPGSTTASGSGTPATGLRSALGNTYQYGYGQLAVRVTVNGSTITKVDTVGLQTAESYSQQIAQQVIPLLRHEVLAAQSARVNGFSGATYTSEAYLYSLQSALDKLHKK